MKEVIKLGLSLMLITLIAALALAFTNKLTRPYIEKNRELAIKNNLNKAHPEAENFEEIDGRYKALKKDETLGYVYEVEKTGYSSVVKLVVGVDMQNTIKGVAVVSQQETPGLGAKVTEKEFLEQFEDVKLENAKLKANSGEIDAITGATITSTAVTNAVQQIKPIETKATPMSTNESDT